MQLGILRFQLFHTRHHRNVHPAILRTSLVKGRRADDRFAADAWNTNSSLNSLDGLNDLTDREVRSLHV